MSGTFGKALQALVFIDFYGQPQGGSSAFPDCHPLIKRPSGRVNLLLLRLVSCAGVLSS